MRHDRSMADTASNKMVVPLTAFVAGGLVSLLLGVYGSQHKPTFEPITTFGFGSMFQMKVYLTTAVGILAVGQVIGALWLYGKLGIQAPSWLGNAHRATGALAVLISLPVAYHCLWALGYQSDDGTRVLLHSLAGCAVYGALVVKVVAVRTRSAPGWFLPVAGGLLFAAVICAAWTSAVWYVGEHGWPDGSY